MRKILGLFILISLCIVTNSWASFSDYQDGALTGASQLTTGGNWSNVTITWDVNKGDSSTTDAGKWQYIYTLSGAPNASGDRASFIAIETLLDFKIIDPSKNLISYSGPTGLTVNPALQTSPISPSIYFTFTPTKTPTLTFVTNTTPMWGDIYVGQAGTSYAKNKVADSVLVPTPLPTAAWMLGAGLAGLVVIRRKRQER